MSDYNDDYYFNYGDALVFDVKLHDGTYYVSNKEGNIIAKIEDTKTLTEFLNRITIQAYRFREE